MVKKILYNKYDPVLYLYEDENGKLQDVKEVENKGLLPISLQDNLSIEAFESWEKKRRIPKNREYIKKVDSLYGESWKCNPNMFSLSDQYWIRNKNEKWEKLNFFTNTYSTCIGDLFFKPWDNKKDQLLDTMTPDLTTNGILKKTWIQEDGVNKLIKASSPATHQEPLNEVLASVIMEKLNIIPFVRYDLCIYGIEICSICDNFVDENTEFVPAIQIYAYENRDENETVYTHLLRMCDVFEVPDAKEFIDNMIFIDFLTGNEDRHLGNFGFLRYVDGPNKGRLVMAPLFDSGSAFWNGNPEQSRKIFGDVEKNIVKKVKTKYDLKQLNTDFGYQELVMSYPGISGSIKDRIIKGIRIKMREINQKEIEIFR